MSDGQAWTLTEAAADCRRRDEAGQISSVSRKTLQRMLDRDEFPSAYRAEGARGPESGPWMIPKADLLAAGLIPGAGRTMTEEVPPEPRSALQPAMSLHDPAEAEGLRLQVLELKAELAAALSRAELAEAVNTERAQALDDLRNVVRMLSPGPPTPPPAPEATPPPTHRRWFRRKTSPGAPA